MGTSQDAEARLFAAAKPCDCCKTAAAGLFYRPDSAFTCVACDTEVHDGGGGSSPARAGHGRVWMCEVCEQAPAVVTCKADAAALCATCDHDIHSANPLASRHERVPVVLFHGAAAAEKPTTGNRKLDAHDGFNPDSWISMSSMVSGKLLGEAQDLKGMEFLLQESDQFLDFHNCQVSSQPYGDSVVPVQTSVKPPGFPNRFAADHSSENRFEIDFRKSNISSYNSGYSAQSLSQSVSSSSEVGVVPNGVSLSETSYPFSKIISSGTEIGRNLGSQAVGMDREARVLRYKEKRKNRKFEKTIRYASRKAYAEARPRIKGRFAKRTDAGSDIDRIFRWGDSADFMEDARYGVVPSF